MHVLSVLSICSIFRDLFEENIVVCTNKKYRLQNHTTKYKED